MIGFACNGTAAMVNLSLYLSLGWDMALWWAAFSGVMALVFLAMDAA